MSNSVYYKVSYVVLGGKHPGAIISTTEKPKVGDKVTFDGRVFEVLEVVDLMPPIGDFGFLHVTCRHLRDIS